MVLHTAKVHVHFYNQHSVGACIDAAPASCYDVSTLLSTAATVTTELGCVTAHPRQSCSRVCLQHADLTRHLMQ
jgi:hypothetical protein